MPSEDADAKPDTKARSTSKKAATPRASLDVLRGKTRRSKELKLLIDGEEYSFLLQAISAKDYDRLLNEHPPNVEQRANGMIYNINTFGPALLSRVVVEPDLSEDHWTELWISPQWNRGELMTFFSEAVELCNSGLSLGPTATA